MLETNDLHASSVENLSTKTAENKDPYETVTLAENSLLSPDMLRALKQQATATNLPAPVLQQWTELEEKRLQQVATQQEEKSRQQFASWAQQTQEMLGENWQEEISKAVRAADVFGGESLRQLLEETGLGNHPAIVRTFVEIGKRLSEDVTVVGKSAAQTDKTFTQALYGKE